MKKIISMCSALVMLAVMAWIAKIHPVMNTSSVFIGFLIFEILEYFIFCKKK